jgi:hypothetical protein
VRSRGKAPRKLSDEQRAGLGSGLGILLVDAPGESNRQTVVRLFGTYEAARAGWFDNRAELLARAPFPGRRPPGWWLCERDCEPPEVGEQEVVLRELGVLTADEEQQLAAEAAMRKMPEPPADLGVDYLATIPSSTPEDTHDIDGDIDAAPVPARPQAEVVEAVAEDEAVAAADPPERPIRARENVVTLLPQGPGRPWWQNEGPNPNQGWDTDG